MNAEDLLKDFPLDTPDEQHDLQQESKKRKDFSHYSRRWQPAIFRA